MNTARRTAAILCAVLLTCVRPASSEPARNDTVRVLGQKPRPLEPPPNWHPPEPPPPDLLDRLARARDVHALRIVSREDELGSMSIDKYDVLADRKLKDGERKELLALLGRADSFYDGHGYSPNKCLPNPGVLVLFKTDPGPVRVFFCFECGALLVDAPDFPWIGGSFSGQRPAFTRWVKRVFPKDPIVQGLP